MFLDKTGQVMVNEYLPVCYGNLNEGGFLNFWPATLKIVTRNMFGKQRQPLGNDHTCHSLTII